VKFSWSRTRALLVGLALIVVTNAVVLAGVAYNRSGEPEAVLELTERELRLGNWSWPANENSSIDVHLNWRVAEIDPKGAIFSGYGYRSLYWLQPAQLQELGFDVSGNLEADEEVQRVARQPSRRAWLVLEYEGPAHQASLQRARTSLERAVSLAQANPGDSEFQTRLQVARKEMEREERFASRLFVVDAGADEEALRARYPDRQRYVVVRGRLDVSVQREPRPARVVARVAEVDVNAVRVPYEFRELVEPFARSGVYYRDGEPRFAATVNFGRRFEPWMVDLRLTSPFAGDQAVQ